MRVRLGVEADNWGRAALDPGVVALAKVIEAEGADSISVSDHLLSFASDGPAASASGEETWLEALTSLAAISSATERVRLTASVIILPQRNVLELLKVVTTLAVLSRGRFVLGVGSGWNQREMQALGCDFASRGKRMDEMLTVLRSRQGAQVPAFAGMEVSVPEGVLMAPSGPRIPIYVGGNGTSAVSLRRAVQYGDGWMPYSMTGEFDAEALRRTLAMIREERERTGGAPLDTIYKLEARGHDDPRLESDLAVLAGLGFNEVIVQGIWAGGMEPGITAIRRARSVLDASA